MFETFFQLVLNGRQNILKAKKDVQILEEQFASTVHHACISALRHLKVPYLPKKYENFLATPLSKKTLLETAVYQVFTSDDPKLETSVYAEKSALYSLKGQDMSALCDYITSRWDKKAMIAFAGETSDGDFYCFHFKLF